MKKCREQVGEQQDDRTQQSRPPRSLVGVPGFLGHGKARIPAPVDEDAQDHASRDLGGGQAEWGEPGKFWGHGLRACRAAENAAQRDDAQQDQHSKISTANWNVTKTAWIRSLITMPRYDT
jgi:hypothetical protein